jgi:pilus assembly protein CpaF
VTPAHPDSAETYDFGSYSDVKVPGITSPPIWSSQALTGSDSDDLSARLHRQILEHLNLDEFSKLSEDVKKREIRLAVEQHIDSEKLPLSGMQRAGFIQDLLDEIVGLGPLEKLLRDSGTTDILVNGPFQVYVERKGRLEESSVRFRDEEHLLEIINRIASRIGRHIDETSPIVDARLSDGSRVNAIVRPLSLRGPILSIRRFGTTPLRLQDLLERKALAPGMALLLEAAVKGRLNIIISGGTGSGKTTLLNALSAFIPNTDRIVSIEDAAELQLQQRHVVQLESRPPNVEGKGEVTLRDLVRNSLRMRPNRIIIGECRGPEALDMLQAMNTGHDGSLTTLHANSPRDALSRLEMMLMMAGLDVPLNAMREQIASAVRLIVQVDRQAGGARRVTSITEISGREKDTIMTQEIFRFHQLGVDSLGAAFGQFEAIGIRPSLMTRLKAMSIDLPEDLFREGILQQN